MKFFITFYKGKNIFMSLTYFVVEIDFERERREALDNENSNSASVPTVFSIVLMAYYASFTSG